MTEVYVRLNDVRATGSATELAHVVDPLLWQDRAVPPREWIVDEWIPNKAVTLLTGDGGVGKSLIAQMLLTSASIGRAWLGLPTKACKTIGIFCEDDPEELVRRQEAINRAFDVQFGDLENLLFVSRLGMDNVMVDFDRQDQSTVTSFHDLVHAKVTAFGAQIIVIDTAADTFGGNENFRPQVRQFVNLLRRIALDANGAVVLTAHPSVAGISSGSGISGSTTWNNTVRSRLYLLRPREDDGTGNLRILRRMKANYAGSGDEIRIEWINGVFRRPDEDDGMVGAIKRRRVDQAFLDCLDALEDRNTPVSDRNRSGNYAPKEMSKMPEAEGQAVADLERAMHRLFHSGRIVNRPYGPPSKGWHRIVRADDR